MAVPDVVQEFEETLILQQGALGSFEIDLPKVTLQFPLPKRFEIHFIRVGGYRINLPLTLWLPVKQWSACRDSDYLSTFHEERTHRYPKEPKLDSLCHFRIEFQSGHLDVLADDAVYMMVAR